MPVGPLMDSFASPFPVAEGLQRPLTGSLLPGVKLAHREAVTPTHFVDAVLDLSGLLDDLEFLSPAGVFLTCF